MSRKNLIFVFFILFVICFPRSVSADHQATANTIILNGSVVTTETAKAQIQEQLDLPPQIMINEWVNPEPADIINVAKSAFCSTIWDEQTKTLLVFTQPLQEMTMKQQKATAQKLADYFNLDIYQLPTDLHLLKSIYGHYIHPDSLEKQSMAIQQALAVPTHWGATTYLHSELIAASKDYAVFRYQVKYLEGTEIEYIHGICGFKRYHDQWLML